MIITVDVSHNIGDFVYLQTDPNQFKRQIVGIEVTQKDKCYLVALGEVVTKHYDCELSKEEVTENRRIPE